MDLKALGGQLICQKDSFLCAARGVSIGIAFQKKIGVGLFGGEGFIMQKLEGDGLCFVHAGGTIHALRSGRGRDAARRHRLPGGAAAERQLRHPVRRQGQDGALRRRRASSSPRCTGPGRVWLQSLPLSRMADRIYARRAADPAAAARRKARSWIAPSASAT